MKQFRKVRGLETEEDRKKKGRIKEVESDLEKLMEKTGATRVWAVSDWAKEEILSGRMTISEWTKGAICITPWGGKTLISIKYQGHEVATLEAPGIMDGSTLTLEGLEMKIPILIERG